MTKEEIDIAAKHNILCRITVNGIEYKHLYRITGYFHFWREKYREWDCSVVVSNTENPNENYTVGLNEIRPIEGQNLFIAEKLKQARKQEAYEKCKDKLMCRKVTE